MSKQLTTRQREVLTLIKRSLVKRGMAPTRAELGEALGITRTAVQDHLKAIEAKGAIVLGPLRSRAIDIKSRGHAPNKATHAAMAQARQMTGASESLRLHAVRLLSLPLIGRVAAGSPILAQENVEHIYQLDATLFKETPDYLLRVVGLSMKDMGILEGDLIGVKRTSEVKNGDIAIARLNDEVTVKSYWKFAQRIELRAANPDFETILLSNRDLSSQQFALEGKYVGLVRR